MNKVTSYLKNVGKSIAYATVEVSTKKLIPEVTEFTDTNKDLFKAVYSTVAHSKQSIRYGTNLAKQTQIYKDINAGINNALEDIKTGNFYNKGRAEAAVDAAGASLAGGFDDFGDDFDFGDWDDDDGSLDDFNDKDESSVTKGDVVVADSVIKSGNLSAQLISKTVANTSSNIIKTNMATTNMMMAQNVELVAGIRTSIAGVHASINSVLKFSQEVITPHFNTQSQYFTDSMNVMRENNAILKEMLEMQRNVYKNEMQKANSNDQYGNVFSGGTLDLTEYAKAIWKNSKNYFDKTGMFGMLTSEMGGTSMLGQMFSNPLGFAVTNIVEKYIPRDFAKQVASFSKTLGNMFPVMITRLNKWKKDGSSPFFTFLGSIFGLNTENKTGIDTSKYNKGAVPFDGITRKAIVDVIPEHLSRIESLLSGSSQRTYDFETGKWMSAKDIKKKKESDYESVVKSSFSDLNDEIKTFITTLEKEKGLKADTKRNLEADIYKMMKEFFEGDELFSPNQIKKKSKEYGYTENELMEQFGEMLSNVPVSKLSSVYANMYDSKSRYSRNMTDAENKGYDIIRKLFDNSNPDSHLIHDKEFKDEIVGTKAGINILNSRDKHGMNALDYLKQILVNVSYIRQFGGSNSGSDETRKPNFKNYNKRFDRIKNPKNIVDLQNRQKDSDERYNKYNYDANVSPEDAAAAAAYKVKKTSRFSDLDEDEFKNFGTRYKEKNKWMEEMEEIPGDTFTQKWANAQSMKQKQILIMGSLSDIARKPASLLTGMIATAEKSIYNFLFQAETDEFDDASGEKIKGFFPAMLNRMRSSWDKLTTTIDEKFISPLVKKYGLDEKWENLKDKFKNSKPMDMLRNAKDNVKNALFKDLGGIYNYTKNSVSDVVAPVIYDKNIVKARTDALKKRYIKSNEKDLENLKNDLSGYSKEEIEYLKQNASPELLKMIEQAGFAEGGAAVVEQGGSIQVSPGEIVNVARLNKSGISEDRKKELDNALLQMSNIAKGRTTRTRTTFAKVRRLNEKARETNSTVFSDTMTKAASEMKQDIVDPVKIAVTNFLGVKGNTPEEQEADINKQKKTILGTVTDIFTEMKGEGANTASKMIIGGGLGLLSGIVGGPLIGAGIGAATSLIKNSTTINEAIFGKDVVDNEGKTTHEGGIISKDVQDTFKKFIPDMGKYGAVGAVGSLLTPFGPLGGAAIGAGIGFIKNSQTMNEMIFGEEITNEDGSKSRKGGLLTQQRLDKIKKFLPKAAVGALGGMVLGPFGLMGNAALGASVGMLTGTEDFKDLILGEDDGSGNRFGGIKGAMQEHFIEPLKSFGRNLKDDFFGFIKESMIDPLNDAITPIATEMAFVAKKIGIGFPKWLLSLGKDYIAQPILSKLNDYIGEPIAKGIKSIFGGLFSRAKGLISLPFRAVGALGNATRKRQIKAGRDAGTAKDRLSFANKKNMGDYNYRAFDEKLAENSDNKEYLEELTARTGMLAHGSEYFDREIKKARTELSRVLDDYYKLGWFKGANKRSYKRIRQYIHDNNLDAAINELTNINETRTSGGKLEGTEANEAIARFVGANKNYQAIRDAKNKFGNINESDNAAWMEQQFGKDWKNLKADRLFDYSRKELSAAGGRSIAKADLFKDPTKLVTKGDEQINNTLNKILNVITHGKAGEFVDEADNIAYNAKAQAGAAAAKATIDARKAKLKHKFAKFAFSDATINLLYTSKNLQDLVTAAKSQGVTYDDDTVAKIAGMKLNKTQYSLLKNFPSVAYEKKEDILKALDYTRNNKATFFKNRFFGAKHVRNQNLGMMNLAGRDINGISTGSIKTMSKEELEAQNITPNDKYTYISTNYGVRKYYKNDKGEMTLDMSDAETKESLQKEQEDHGIKQAFMGKVSGITDSVLGIFNRNKNKDEEEKKEPWYKKLFNGEIGSKIKFGGAILGLLTGIGALKGIWDNSKENNGIVYRIGSAVGNAVSPFITKIGNWFTNSGEYEGKGGLQGFLTDHVYPNLFKGMNVVFGTILPAVVATFIKNIPNLIKGALKGVAGLFGWWNRDDSAGDLKINAQNQGSPNSNINDGSSGSWLGTVRSDATAVATSINNINTDNTGNTNYNDNTSTGSNNIANDVINNATTNNNSLTTELGTQLYTKDDQGNLIAATNDDYNNMKDLYNQEGTAHWVYDEDKGKYVAAEDSKTNKSTLGGSIGKRLGYGALRGFATGKESFISKIGKRVSARPKNLKALNLGASAIKGVTKVFGGASSLSAYARESLENAPSKVASKLTKEAAKTNKKSISSIIEACKAYLSKIFKSKDGVEKLAEAGGAAVTKKKTLGDLACKLIDNIMTPIAKQLEKLSGTKLGKILGKIASRKVLGILFLVGDFISGWDRAEAILTIKEPSPLQKLIAAIANALTNFAFAGFISTSWLINKLVDIVFPIFKIDVSEYKEDVSDTKAEIDKYNSENADNKSYEQYLEENYSTTGKVKKWFSNIFGSNKTLKNTSNDTKTTKTTKLTTSTTAYSSFSAKGTGSEKKNSGFVSQLDSKYRGKKFNIAGDTEYQTIGDSGCAPATAANVLNFFRGQGSTMDDASKAALKYKDKNGGVTPDYFNDYLGKQGIGTYSTMNKQELVSGIGQGKPTVLLGTDPTNKAKTPYGSSSSHYVLATGFDGKGNVIIQDPESKRPNALYPAKDVINQSQMGVITGRGTGRGRSITSKVRSKLGKIGFGRGHKAQFEDLAKWSPLSDSEIDTFIKKSNAKSPFTGKAINKAAKASGLNPRYILAHAAVESAWGLSNYGKKYHNYFGIGAFDSNPDNAVNYGNSGMESGLIEGAKWIRENYYNAGQTTVYTMRYNNGKHQYCTSTTWVDTIASIMEAMPANTSASYHDMDNSVTGDSSSSTSSNSSSGLFGMITEAAMSYYDSNLISLIFGDSDTGDTTETNGADGITAKSGTPEAVIQVASQEVGTKANESNQSNKYGIEYGLDNQPWCAIFVWWVFNKAGCPEQFYGGKKTASVPSLLDYYRRNSQMVDKKNGQPGDIIFFNWDGGTAGQHVGIIVKNNGNGNYNTIEGNTNYEQAKKGMVAQNDRYAKNIVAIARPNYATSSGEGTINKFKSMTYFNPDIKYKSGNKNIAAILSGKGTGKTVKYGINHSGSTMASNVLNNSRKYSTNTTSTRTIGTSILTGRATTNSNKSTSLPNIKSVYGVNNSSGTAPSPNYSSTGRSSSGSTTDNLLSVIVEILQIIANNSEKLSEIVTLLSKALDLNLTDNDISGLSSNNTKIKNKIANALKAQGSANGLGSSSMSSSTESLAAAMYSIARA